MTRASRAVVIVAALAFATAGLGTAGTAETREQLRAVLNAAQQTPPQEVKTPGAAGRFTATFVGYGRSKGGFLTWRLTFRRLSGPAVAAYVRLGAKGKTGPIELWLCRRCRSGAHKTVATSPRLATALRTGTAYVTIRTPSNPLGEIRGQIGTAR
jgi:hypothetical protein